MKQTSMQEYNFLNKNQLRHKIEELDQQILETLSDQMKVEKQIFELKKEIKLILLSNVKLVVWGWCAVWGSFGLIYTLIWLWINYL